MAMEFIANAVTVVGSTAYDAASSTWTLPKEVQKLSDSLPKAQALIDRGEWGRFKNAELAHLLLRLKCAVYDAEDLIDEFNTQYLKHNIEGGGIASSLYDFAGDLLTNRARQITEVQGVLDEVGGEMGSMLSLLKVEPEQHGEQLMPKTGDLVQEPTVFGRDEELRQVLELLGVPLAACKRRSKKATTTSSARVPILPIVGMGGVGKTTLAQRVCNHEEVKLHFDKIIWACVSDRFDTEKLTKEILESFMVGNCQIRGRLKDLQANLRMRLESQRFLLVLDDVWTEDKQQWDQFSASLMFGLQGSMILVTTRSHYVANLVGSLQPILLQGLPPEVFGEFFERCAFGRHHKEEYPQLECIGKDIAARLCGSPLAGKTLGRLLSLNLDEVRWMTIKNSELWELHKNENEILPALQLSYQYLPAHLKRCFALCSMYPKNYSFERDELVDVWVSEGFVASQKSVLAESMGRIYLGDLISRFFLQTDPGSFDKYMMHDLMHDLAQSVSVGECYLIQDANHKSNLPHTIRHLSIEAIDHELTSSAQIRNINKWRSVRVKPYSALGIVWKLTKLTNIRLLILRGCQVEELPDTIGDLELLRHIDLTSSTVKRFPNSLWSLYNLQVLKANFTKIDSIHQDMTKLINLRRLQLPDSANRRLSLLSGIGRLSFLQDLPYFSLQNTEGHRISELKHMNQLHGSLSITCIEHVQSKEDADEARLVTKQHLQGLELRWSSDEICLAAGQTQLDNDVLESLRPPPNLKRLSIEGYLGGKSPSWLQPQVLRRVEHLKLCHTPNLKDICISFPLLQYLSFSCVGVESLSLDKSHGSSSEDYRRRDGKSHSSTSNTIQSLRLKKLLIVSCKQLRNLDSFLLPEYLPCITSMRLVFCSILESLPIDKFGGFVCLEELEVKCCKLQCPRKMVLPPSVKHLSLEDCGQLDQSIPDCLEKLSSLTLLRLVGCSNVASICLASCNPERPKCVVLEKCPNLSSWLAVSQLSHPAQLTCLSLSRLALFASDSSRLDLWDLLGQVKGILPYQGIEHPTGCPPVLVLGFTSWSCSVFAIYRSGFYFSLFVPCVSSR